MKFPFLRLLEIGLITGFVIGVMVPSLPGEALPKQGVFVSPYVVIQEIPQHIPYNPLQPYETLPEYPYNHLHPVYRRPLHTFAKPAGVDLDVTYISRTPLYSRYQVWYTADGKPYLRPGTENDKRWPDPGETVTFTAHIINKGTVASGRFDFKWFIDGQEVHSGVHNSLAPGEEATESYQWTWSHSLDGERLLGSHTVRFTVDPANAIAETYESNNSLEDRTDALSLVLAVTPELYAALETPVDPQWPFSAEDWLQKQIAAMNAAFARSIYPSAPNGILERVRLDKILVTSEPPSADTSVDVDGGFFLAADDRNNNPYYDPITDVSGSLIHELSHQLGLIDLYNLGFEVGAVEIVDHNGLPLQMETGLPATGLMLNPGIRPLVYEEHSALALNVNKGYRRGYYGEYLFDVPMSTYLRVLDNQGAPAPNVTVRLFQAGPGHGSFPIVIDNTPEITGVTDSNGLLMLPNRSVGSSITTRTGHTLCANPFGVIDVVGEKDEFIVELTKGAHQEYGWLEITQFNLKAWQGNMTTATLTISSHIPPAVAPAPPSDLRGRVEQGRVHLSWSANPFPVASYNVYRTVSRPTFTYERIAQGITNLSFVDNYDHSMRAVAYAITAVDSLGRESGFSPFFNTFRLVNPAAITLSDNGKRIVLDPQNGYALLTQSADGRYLDVLGSVHYHLEHSFYMTRDQAGRLLFSHPGDWYSQRHSIRVADQNAEPLFEFGERGSGPGQFENPAGVAVWGKLCTTEGPYGVDEHTLLLLHFDGSYSGAQGEIGMPNGTSFTTGRYAQGILIDANDTLTYPTAGNLNRTQGAIEFWIRPNWNGGDGQNYTFFEVGSDWFNRMRIMKDGANNLRFILWDSNSEYGVAYNVAHWQAGEWHHVAVTWQENNISLFVDGEQQASNNSAKCPDSLAPTIHIGSSLWHDQQAWAVLDEFRISDIPRVGNSDTCNYRILVSDSGNNRLQAFDAKGEFISAFGSTGSGPGQFNDPQGIAVTSDGYIVVADRGNNRLQLLSFDGRNFGFVRAIYANLNQPTGVAAYGTRIIIADTGNNKVKV
ncbi:MAG: 6-bladed beta-propeller, partial [Thermoflexales bacterium]|nr:6-bladed beta-propeller [Thermoflexales bacterium]